MVTTLTSDKCIIIDATFKRYKKSSRKGDNYINYYIL